jgi:hypothetical protein
VTHPRPDQHPWWCDYPQAPADSTHTHTRAIGVARLGDEVSVDAVMVQAPDDAAASVTLHVATRRHRLSITTDDRQVWLLAGVLVDATVMLRRAALDEPAPPSPAAPPGRPARGGGFLATMARRRKARASGRISRSFRCLPPGSGESEPPEAGDTDAGPW